MQKHPISLLLLLLMAAPSWSQDNESSVEPGDTAEPAEVEESPEDVDVNDDDLDIQTYEEDEDDFVPSEEIPADEPIPFPSNI